MQFGYFENAGCVAAPDRYLGASAPGRDVNFRPFFGFKKSIFEKSMLPQRDADPSSRCFELGTGNFEL
jgi:hypothetical protein